MGTNPRKVAKSAGRTSCGRILIVAADKSGIADLIEHLVVRHQSDLAHAESIAEAESLTSSDAFDAILVAMQLNDGDAFDLLANDGIASETPVIILENSLDAERALSALRAGAMDLLPMPYDLDRLSTVLCESIRQRREQRRAVARAVRLRRMSSRMIRDRRELRQRIDLVCQDLVQAYRQLAEKVVAGAR